MNNLEENGDLINWKILQMEVKHAEQQNDRNLKVINELRTEYEKLSKETETMEASVRNKRNEEILLKSHYDLIQKKLNIKRNQEITTISTSKQSKAVEQTQQILLIQKEIKAFTKQNEILRREITKNDLRIQKLDNEQNEDINILNKSIQRQQQIAFKINEIQRENEESQRLRFVPFVLHTDDSR